MIEAVARLVEKQGIDAWFELNPVDLLGAEAEQYEKVTDIMDVWFDSGVVHHCVPALRSEIVAPADLYLEGSDQHRGWFHSSLLTSVAMHDRAPYKAVLTHGFTIDDKGRKMSKSLGNVIVPQKVVGTLGADVLRLWVAATDYSNEMSLSDEILKRVTDSYRRIRNTVRFLLSNAVSNPGIEWSQLLELRAAVSRELEQLRVTGAIGAPLDAGVTLYASEPAYSLLHRLGDELRFVFITSEARVFPAADRPADAVPAQATETAVWIKVQALDHGKCVRCWQKRHDVGANAAHPELCGRCVSNVDGAGEERRYV